MKLYNSLSKKKEEFKPVNPEIVGMYLCGPTVYDFVTIGNFRTYFLGDITYRILSHNGYKVKYIMNLTDVGHLTGDNIGEADFGDDRLELAAAKEGKSAKDIANFYIADFLRNYEKLNLTKPEKFTRATEYIEEQIALIKELEQKGYTYLTSDGVYFDTSKFPSYGQLSGYTDENVLEGARVEPNPEKKSPTDFALWKLSPKTKLRWQEWDSPWGRGFPGWHIECSAMALTEIGQTLDIHLGGEDLKMTHHQNEIAQSEACTGKTFVNYWMHGAFLTVNNGRMGKSLGNAYTLPDIESKGYSPFALRYFYMTAHYRSKLNFTWEALSSSQQALKKIYDLISSYQEDENAMVSIEHLERFNQAINDDINMPQAIAVVWDLLKSEISEGSKISTMLVFDKVLGLNIEEYVGFEVPSEIQTLAKTRLEYKKNGIWDKADQIRRELETKGFVIEDIGSTFKIKRKI